MGYKISALTAAASSPTGTDLFEVSRYNGSTYDSRKMSWTQIIAGISLVVGTVTTVSVSSANGFGGSVANPTTTPAISITTSVSGLMYGNGSAAAAATDSQVTSYLITGVSVSGGSISGTDTMLQAFGKLQNQINGLIGGTIYQGTWNATTNTPALSTGVGTNGYYYIVATPGATNLDGITDWKLGDWVIFAGSAWQKVDNTDAVISVNGLIGAVALTGTASRITVSGANVFDISAAYVGQTSITTLGTISTGSWNATAIPVNKGGTNITSYTIGDLIYASGATTLSKLGVGSAGQVLTLSGGVPTWATPAAAVNIAGGASWEIPYQSAPNTTGFINVGSAGQYLTNGSGAEKPYWQTLPSSVANISGGAASQLLYQDGLNSTAFLANGTSGQILQSNGAAAPSWETPETLDSGTYTPALTDVTNLDSSTPRLCTYTRVGDIVSVCGQFVVDLTASGNFRLRMSLPIASNFVNNQNGSGTAQGLGTSTSNVAWAALYSDITNDEIYINGQSNLTVGITYYFNFSYRVL